MNITRSQTGTIIRSGFILCFMILHFLMADLSFGQGHPGRNGTQDKSDTKWSTSIRGGYVYQFDTDMDNSNGSFTTDRFLSSLG